MIRDNLEAVLSNIRAAALRVGRDPNEITLVGVTKSAEVPAINEAIRAGLRHVAENRLQLAQAKFPLLETAGVNITRHMIGHLQTNKVRDVLPIFDLIHSVDSGKLADEIQKRSAAVGKVAEILVQVDIAREETKFGLPEDELAGLMAHLASCPNIRTLGLMTMAPLTEDRETIRDVFRRCRELFQEEQRKHPASGSICLRHLSMGMSHDYEIAVEEGATLVRIGSALFR
ncbi:MAG: YggS family pyridoxal phosphate-dependent enzyme [Candidatus Omnitrophica bacterium]|nr:YggS family pyridoxal phosphate-dependent enzyme [Candidatus Omnitrophota bacterium]